MSQCPRPRYTDTNSTQTLQQGLDEYYAVNPHVTDPRKLPPEFAKILLAHDVSHVVYGCDTGNRAFAPERIRQRRSLCRGVCKSGVVLERCLLWGCPYRAILARC